MADTWTQFLRRAALWAIVTPFFLLSFLPGGAMPVQSADGLLMVICTGDGPLEIRVDPVTGEPVERDPHDGSGTCDWAMAKPAVSLASAPDFPAPTVVLVPSEPEVLPVIRAVARATGLPPSTGPPSAL
ncbi:hypothetical protein [Pseudoruegeria sp. HB172150]|uniref:hypothetical protein n=1 Tax=Pseudoruegeria sp. HB172150 TaxID=2721164 RepID=UPI001551993A|nr:hypothetical protein [Pseudoruegeria sp. HB172150]